MYKVQLRNNVQFECAEDKTIFEGSRSAGVVLEYSCLSGRCRTCMVRVLEGSAESMQQDIVLTEEEKRQGYILSCISRPCSDISLDVEDLSAFNLSPVRIIPAKIDSIQQVTSDILKVTLRLPPASNFSFNAGQYINVIRGDHKRSYSIGSRNSDANIDLYIKNYPGGVMSRYWFEEAKPGDLLRIEGPLGTFFFRPATAKQVIFIATGTGIAPVISIVESLAGEPGLQDKEVHILWGMRSAADLFWQPALPGNVKFIPVLSRSDKDWNGEKGYVQHLLTGYIRSINDVQVYACGSDAMINESRQLLGSLGLPGTNFYSDAFVTSN